MVVSIFTNGNSVEVLDVGNSAMLAQMDVSDEVVPAVERMIASHDFWNTVFSTIGQAIAANQAPDSGEGGVDVV